MLDRVSSTPQRVRTLFLSDIHLGTRGCQADKLLDLLRLYEADTIYLVGDIVDGWQLKSAWYWPQLHNDVVQKLLRQARKGVRLLYIPGNHDEFLRDYYGTHFGGIEVLEDAIHVAADGKRYLVIHGDLFDVIIRHARWLALLAALALVAAIAWTGHAGSTLGELGNLHLAADVLHLCAASAWIGGLVGLAILFEVGRRRPALEWKPLQLEAISRFSILGMISVAALIVSGLVNAWILVGSFRALVVTDYGRLLLLKIAAFAIMVAFAAVNRLWLTPRLARFLETRTDKIVDWSPGRRPER